MLDEALPRLRRGLGLAEGEQTQRLQDALEAAEEEILRYLNRSELPASVDCLMVELAALRFLRSSGEGGLKSESYSEGQLSQSRNYLSPEEYVQGEAALLRSLAPWRQVKCREAGLT